MYVVGFRLFVRAARIADRLTVSLRVERYVLLGRLLVRRRRARAFVRWTPDRRTGRFDPAEPLLFACRAHGALPCASRLGLQGCFPERSGRLQSLCGYGLEERFDGYRSRRRDRRRVFDSRSRIPRRDRTRLSDRPVAGCGSSYRRIGPSRGYDGRLRRLRNRGGSACRLFRRTSVRLLLFRSGERLRHARAQYCRDGRCLRPDVAALSAAIRSPSPRVTSSDPGTVLKAGYSEILARIRRSRHVQRAGRNDDPTSLLERIRQTNNRRTCARSTSW